MDEAWWNSIEALSRWNTILGWASIVLIVVGVASSTFAIIINRRISTLRADLDESGRNSP